MSVVSRVCGDVIEFSLRNISADNVYVNEIEFGDPAESGFWLFMYDPETKKNQHAFVLVERMGGWSRGVSARILRPNEAIEKNLPLSKIKDYFLLGSDCYYITAVYRKRSGNKIFFSSPSVPIYICDDSI